MPTMTPQKTVTYGPNDQNSRTVPINVRFTALERAMLKAEAKRRGTSVAGILRLAIESVLYPENPQR